MQLSIIILSYNTKDLTKICLNSIYNLFKDKQVEVIIVDNASHDGSQTMIKKEFPNVKLIESDQNLGFAKGVNLGAKNAKGDYLLFLNSDAQLQDKNIFKLIDFLKTNQQIGIAGGLLLNNDKTPQRSFGKFYTLPVVVSMLIGGDKVEMINQSVKEQEVDWVSGGFMLISRKLFENIHGFDESFFMYIEDMELCYRVKKSGLGVYFYPLSSALHVGQGSSNRSFAVVNIYKGLTIFYKKHRNKLEYLILRFLLLSKAILLLLFGTMTNDKYLKSTYSKVLKQ